jgi:chemotaxis protein CheX
VRAAAIAQKRGGNKEMERIMALSLRGSLDQVSDPKNLDASVEEVFQLMLGVNCQREEVARTVEPQSVTSVVGFGGLLSGACVFRTGGVAALKIAARMTGMEFEEIDDTVKDGIGVPDLSANCGLSVPAVITGRDYEIHVQAPEFQIKHIYAFEDWDFEVMIVCDGIQ